MKTRLKHYRHRLLRLITWPLRTLLRITRDGILFGFLAITCGVIAIRASDFANIPILIALILCSLLSSALFLGNFCLRNLKILRRCSERTFAGEPLQVTLQVENLSRLPAAGLVLEESVRDTNFARRNPLAAQESQRIQPGFGNVRTVGGSAGQTFTLAVGSREKVRTQYQLLIRRRGIYEFGRTRISTVFPFGFWRTEDQIQIPGRLAVYPRLGEIDATLFKELEHALLRIKRQRNTREEMDFRSLREYRQGDNPKWIHWRSTARLGRQLIKEWEEPQTRRVLLLLDTNLQRVGIQRLPAFELAISFAGTAVRELLRRDCEVTFATLNPDKKPCVLTLSRERRNLDVLLEELAELQPDNTRTLANLKPALSLNQLRHTYVLVLGLGSIRMRISLKWLYSMENEVRIMDVRSDEFRQVFRRTSGVSRDELDEDLLMSLDDDALDELSQEELALVS